MVIKPLLHQKRLFTSFFLLIKEAYIYKSQTITYKDLPSEPEWPQAERVREAKTTRYKISKYWAVGNASQ